MISIFATALVLLWAIGMMTGNLLGGAIHLLIVGALVMMLFTSVSLRKPKSHRSTDRWPVTRSNVKRNKGVYTHGTIRRQTN